MSTRLQPWLEIVTVSTIPSYNIRCLFLSPPKNSKPGKLNGPRFVDVLFAPVFSSVSSLAWLDITVRATRLSVRHTARRHWDCERNSSPTRRSLVPRRRSAGACRQGAYIGCCAGGGDKCMGNEVRGVAYITVGDINLVFWTNW